MLKKRPSDPFWVALSFDPALIEVESHAMEEYLRTRDIRHLPIDLKSKTLTTTGDKVALVKCRPLTVKGESLYKTYGEAAAADLIIGSHVVEIANIDGCSCRPNKDGETELTEESLGDNGMDGATREELLRVIVESGRGANGDDRGFTSPGTWRADRMRSHLMPAVIARLREIEKSVAPLDLAPNQADKAVTPSPTE